MPAPERHGPRRRLCGGPHDAAERRQGLVLLELLDDEIMNLSLDLLLNAVIESRRPCRSECCARSAKACLNVSEDRPSTLFRVSADLSRR